jgi:hypothetical protein
MREALEKIKEKIEKQECSCCDLPGAILDIITEALEKEEGVQRADKLLQGVLLKPVKDIFNSKLQD